MRRAIASVLFAVFVLFTASPGAHAAQRWASPASAKTTGSCFAVEPCRLAQAVSGAAAGDEVILLPGTYAVADELSPSVRISVHGVDGQPRPVLVGDADLDSSTLSFKVGGTLRHLELRATAHEEDALTMQGGLAEDVVLISARGDGARLAGSAGGTVLRDSVVWTQASDDDTAGLKLRDSGDVMLRNVTVIARAGTGIRCGVSHGSVTLVNTLVRGDEADVDAGKGRRCSASYSNFRPARSSGLPAGAGNQQLEPVFRDPAGGDYRPAAGSPTIDAGGADALLGATDPDGCARTLGAAPDIGAYEYSEAGCGSVGPVDAGPPVPVAPVAPAPEPEPAAELPPGVPAPVQGVTVVVSAGQGKVRVRRPGTTRFRSLTAGARVPVGSELDARAGRVRLVTSVGGEGALQAGTFWGGRFTVRQRRTGAGMTTLTLRGSSFRRCRAASASSVATASKRRPVRRLWSQDRDGRFRTYGNNSVATARGTAWLTEDRCDGTLTRVFEGAVSVRDRARRRTTLVKAGESYLARR